VSLLNRLGKSAPGDEPNKAEYRHEEIDTNDVPQRPTEDDEYINIRKQIYERVINSIGAVVIQDEDIGKLRSKLSDVISSQTMLAGLEISPDVKVKLIADYMDELVGLGPIEPFLNDRIISRIIVSSEDDIMVERRGVLEQTGKRFNDQAHLGRIIAKIADALGSRIDSSIPTVESRLPDGSRIHMTIPPLAARPTLNISKLADNPFKQLMDRTAKKQSYADDYFNMKHRLQERLIAELSPELGKGKKDDVLYREIEGMVNTLINDEGTPLNRTERAQLVSDLQDEILGLGPLEALLRDPDISEIMVNSAYQVYVEKKGKLKPSDTRFKDNDHLMHIIEKIVAPLGRRIDESSPMVDARLPDGSRVNAIIPPMALKGPCLTIRKFSKDPFTIADLINFGTLTREMALFIEACVKARLNIVVSGGTGSGKTTTLNVLSSMIPNDERIVTIEDAAELQLRQEHVVSLESRPPNIEGKGQVAIRDLVRNALRMRPDRIVVGEVRGGEALDMLQAMNTGHDGSLTTGHANTPRDILSRLETMVLMAGMELPVRAIREQISSAIDLIIQQGRLRDGTRRLLYITEVLGMEGDIITLQDIFVFEQKGVDTNGAVIGRFRPTGIRPSFYDRIEQAGIKLSPTMFSDEGEI